MVHKKLHNKKNMQTNLQLIAMTRKDIDPVCDIIHRTLSAADAAAAKKTYDAHFFCKENRVDDGRHYFIILHEEQLIGTCGLHHYTWGPEENVWGGWLSVAPEYQRKGYGMTAFKKTLEMAKTLGYKKFFIETSNDLLTEKARNLYERLGFVQAGSVSKYWPDNIDMLVYSIDLI